MSSKKKGRTDISIRLVEKGSTLKRVREKGNEKPCEQVMLHPFRVPSFTRLKPVVCASLRPPATISQPSRLPCCTIFPEYNLFSSAVALSGVSLRVSILKALFGHFREVARNAGTTSDRRKQTAPFTVQFVGGRGCTMDNAAVWLLAPGNE